MRGIRIAVACLAAGLCAAVASCTALGTQGVPDYAASAAGGIPYFLPRTLVRYRVDLGESKKTEIEAVEIADRRNPYFLAYQESWLADENLCVARTATGLLQRVYFGAQDRTADILLNVLEITARAGLPTADVPGARSVGVACAGSRVSEWMDPYDAAALARFNESLKVAGRACARISPLLPPSGGTEVVRQCPADAVCFATRSRFLADVDYPDGKPGKRLEADVASERDIGWVQVKRASFNKRITMLDLDDGVLTAMRVRKDSELLGVSELPLKAVERVLAVPGNAIGMAFSGYEERLLYLQQRTVLKEAGATPPAEQDRDPELTAQVFGCVSSRSKE